MGLAASQATLLSLTARIHDTEFEAQTIMENKTALATREDQAYEKYQNALDAKKLQIKYTDGTTTGFVDATFSNVCSYQKGVSEQYALSDASTGELIVNDDVYKAYQNYKGGDKYAFAFAMLGFKDTDGCSKVQGQELYDSRNIGVDASGNYLRDGELSESSGISAGEISGQFTDAKGKVYGYTIMNEAEATVYNNHTDNEKLKAAKDAIDTAVSKADPDEVQKAIDTFRSTLYDSYASEIASTMASSKFGNYDDENMGNIDKSELNYYVRLFEGIENAGGCTPISEFAEEGDTGNEWFTNIVQNGRALLNQYSTNNSNKGWNVISTGTSLTVQEVSDDVAIKKAEAEYQQELKKINRQDTKYDTDLKNLETERTALTKELDSVKKVKDENIDRTFKIFS